MTNDKFERVNEFAYARAADLMSTQSAIGFEWSVKLIGHAHFVVGIGSRLVKSNAYIHATDHNTILYCSNNGSAAILNRSRIMYPNLQRQETGDVIRFKFQPHIKKLLIQLKDKQYVINLQDNVYYFPVVQSAGHQAVEAHLI